uniref:Conserved plasma membrane protein n=1 Tax=Macrostomum lignano TaxID=282301 RepID=A0A1I8F295_9PLAT
PCRIQISIELVETDQLQVVKQLRHAEEREAKGLPDVQHRSDRRCVAVSQPSACCFLVLSVALALGRRTFNFNLVKHQRYGNRRRVTTALRSCCTRTREDHADWYDPADVQQHRLLPAQPLLKPVEPFCTDTYRTVSIGWSVATSWVSALLYLASSVRLVLPDTSGQNRQVQVDGLISSRQ